MLFGAGQPVHEAVCLIWEQATGYRCVAACQVMQVI